MVFNLHFCKFNFKYVKSNILKNYLHYLTNFKRVYNIASIDLRFGNNYG